MGDEKSVRADADRDGRTSSLPRDRRARMVCAGVLFGGLGAETFAVSLIWHMVEMSGPQGALLLIPQLVAALVSGMVGAALLERFEPLRVAVSADVVRALAALTAFAAMLIGWPVWVLVVQTILVAMVRPHHAAGVMSGLSRLGIEREDLRTASSLVDNLLRLARILGPALAAGLSLVAGSRFVLMAAGVCFLLALALIARAALERTAVTTDVGSGRPGAKESFSRGLGLVRRSPLLAYCLASQALNAGTWYLGFMFCVALLLADHTAEEATSGLSGFGLATVCYGVGNVVAGLIVARRPLTDPPSYVVAGRAIAGVGLLLLAADAQLWWLCAAAAIAALGTPVADLAFIKVIQWNYTWNDVSKLYRFKVMSEYAGILIALSSASLLVAGVGVSGTIAVCGGVMLVVAAVGIFGLLRHRGLRMWKSRR